MQSPFLEIIIPAYNEEGVLPKCLTGLSRQTYQNFIATIVDDESTDSTPRIIQDWIAKHPANFRSKFFGKVGPGRIRNICAKESKADVLVFTDADCVANPDWLLEITKGFTSSRIVATGGPHLVPQDDNAFGHTVERFLRIMAVFIDFYKPDMNGIRPTRHNPLCNVAYRRTVFLEAGGFREDLWPGEDIELDLRLEKHRRAITYNPQAIVYHYRPKTLNQWKKVMSNYGRAQGKICRERGPCRLIHFLGILAVLAFPILIPVFWLRPSTENLVGVFFGSLDWVKGFSEGLMTNKSLPPSLSRAPKRG